MDRDSFKQFIIDALLGSASAEKFKNKESDLTAWGVDALTAKASTYCDSAWNFCSESNFNVCVLFAELIGSAGFDRDLHGTDYPALFARAERLASLKDYGKE
ncbi:hypothetical protein [Coleofasciculus sp. G2-EDA-02]|uniref:hypothetical protein n=1 Tax=Coleofasciculus sp. G2-EDA-02 TaxID=3069529 RepID=UPI0032F5849D